MSWNRAAAVFLIAIVAAPTVIAQSQRNVQTNRQRVSVPQSAERWVRQLASELEHLQEDLHYERGSYPAGISDQLEQASQAVTHFHHILRRNTDAEHLLRDFEEMDEQVHQLVSSLEQSGDRWLGRQAQRVRYADEQLHYAIRVRYGSPSGSNELLARHAHVLESEAQNLRDLAARIGGRDNGLRTATEQFAEEAEHFHSVIEQSADGAHLQEDFRQLDERWHRVVDRINRSGYGMYLRRTAQNVDRVHNQLHNLLTSSQHGQTGHPHGDDHQHAENPPAENRQRIETRQRTENRQRTEVRQSRPAIEVEIPGIGRFQIPR